MEQQFQQPQRWQQSHQDKKEHEEESFGYESQRFEFLIRRASQVRNTQHQHSDQDFGFRPPEIGEEARKLVVAVTNDPAGNEFLNSLREEETQARLGFRFAGTLAEILRQARVELAGQADEMTDKFAFLEIRQGYDFPVMNSVLRHGCGVATGAMANVDVEGDLPMDYSVQQALGANYVLRSSGSLHDYYLNQLCVPSARSASGVRIAVVDSGFEKTGVVRGFLDLVDKKNRTEVDKFGHGTAMTSIIEDVAKGAELFSIRASDQGPHVSEAMVGVAAATFQFQPDIVNLSFGLPLAQTCSVCGANSGVSRVFYRLLRCLSETPAPQNPPILVAATGNKGVATGFDAPAAWAFTIAVGSINSASARSAFSNYGTSGHTQYILMPGGEQSGGAPSEWIGEAAHKCYGTSASAAYASGVLGLYMANPTYSGLDRASFLAQVLANCRPCVNQNTSEHGFGYLIYR